MLMKINVKFILTELQKHNPFRGVLYICSNYLIVWNMKMYFRVMHGISHRIQTFNHGLRFKG